LLLCILHSYIRAAALRGAISARCILQDAACVYTAPRPNSITVLSHDDCTPCVYRTEFIIENDTFGQTQCAMCIPHKTSLITTKDTIAYMMVVA
jgi:hypothetical protein